MKKRVFQSILALIASVLVLALAGWFLLPRDTRALLAAMPTNSDVLFWNIEQRDAAFRALDSIPLLARSHEIQAGKAVHALESGPALLISTDIDAYMAHQRTAGLVILHDNRIVLEKYGLDFGPDGRWTSFSVAKSITSTLVGAAIKDGYIRSLDDKVTDYIAGLRGSPYDDVTVRQLLTMTSGIAWNEDYSDPASDVAKFNNHKPADGLDVTVSYMRTLPREVPAGSKWVYKTGETNLIGVLVSEATGKNLSEYLSEKIWKPYGMQQDASWILNASGNEISGCCIQSATRDYARFGQFILDGAVAGGHQVVPDDWLAMATRKQADIGDPERGYGFQWWTYSDGSFAAQGIFGQGIFIDPSRSLVIASNSNWPSATDAERSAERRAFYTSVQRAVDTATARATEN
ncbi:MAG: serine hydrolase domain-containing protein [Sphingomonadaceae bacterium]